MQSWMVRLPQKVVTRIIGFSRSPSAEAHGNPKLPSIDESLEVVADVQSEASLGEILPDDELIEMCNQGFRGWDRGEACLFNWALGRRRGLGDRLGSDF